MYFTDGHFKEQTLKMILLDLPWFSNFLKYQQVQVVKHNVSSYIAIPWLKWIDLQKGKTDNDLDLLAIEIIFKEEQFEVARFLDV